MYFEAVPGFNPGDRILSRYFNKKEIRYKDLRDYGIDGNAIGKTTF